MNDNFVGHTTHFHNNFALCCIEAGRMTGYTPAPDSHSHRPRSKDCKSKAGLCTYPGSPVDPSRTSERPAIQARDLDCFRGKIGGFFWAILESSNLLLDLWWNTLKTKNHVRGACQVENLHHCCPRGHRTSRPEEEARNIHLKERQRHRQKLINSSPSSLARGQLRRRRGWNRLRDYPSITTLGSKDHYRR